MSMKVNVTVTTQRDHQVELTEKQLLDLVKGNTDLVAGFLVKQAQDKLLRDFASDKTGENYNKNDHFFISQESNGRVSLYHTDAGYDYHNNYDYDVRVCSVTSEEMAAYQEKSFSLYMSGVALGMNGE